MAIAFQPRGDIDAVAHQIAVALLDDVAEMNADAELDAAVVRHAGVALDHRVLHFDGAAHGVDDAAELDERAVAGALDDAPVMHGDGRIDQIAAQRPQPRQRAILVRAGEPAVADHVGGQDRRELAGFTHRPFPALATKFSAATSLFAERAPRVERIDATFVTIARPHCRGCGARQRPAAALNARSGRFVGDPPASVLGTIG